MADTSNETSGSVVLARSLKIAGEALVLPGTSLILDGEIGSGGAHAVGGILAGMLIGPVGWFLVAADSYSKSITGKGLFSHLKGEAKEIESRVASPA